jgi:hypothetical protein
LRLETDPVSETLCSLEYQAMDKVQKPSSPKSYTPSSEPFQTKQNSLTEHKLDKLKNMEGGKQKHGG